MLAGWYGMHALIPGTAREVLQDVTVPIAQSEPSGLCPASPLTRLTLLVYKENFLHHLQQANDHL